MPPSPPPGSVHARLLEEHEALDAALERLLAAYRTNDRDAASEAFGEFQCHLADHLDLEERLLLPELALVRPREAEQLRTEHRAIRQRVDELGIGVDLHVTRIGAIEGLAQMLRDHAAREDHLLYRWADQVFSDPAARPRLDTFLARGRSPAPAERP